jgi:hypothetical protein
LVRRFVTVCLWFCPRCQFPALPLLLKELADGSKTQKGKHTMTTNPEPQSNAPRFALGKLVSTPGALEALINAGQSPVEFLDRHIAGDWGQVCAADAAENELSVKEGFRILSVYTLKTGTRIWIITEADRSSTCVLLPEEY